MAATSAEMAPGDVERRFALFDYGFRPFFLFAGAYAVIALIAWLTALSTGSWPAEPASTTGRS